MGKFMVTTAIPYASGKSHIGNVYEDVLADAIARFHRKHGDDVYCQVGLDEHGLKIETKAKEAGVSPQEYVDKISVTFKEMLDLLNISYSKLVRTTDPDHCKRVENIFNKDALVFASTPIYSFNTLLYISSLLSLDIC